MNKKNYKNMIMALAACVGTSAISLQSAANSSLLVSIEDTKTINKVMKVADQWNVDYTISPVLNEDGSLSKGMIEINMADRISEAALFRMIKN